MLKLAFLKRKYEKSRHLGLLIIALTKLSQIELIIVLVSQRYSEKCGNPAIMKEVVLDSLTIMLLCQIILYRLHCKPQ